MAQLVFVHGVATRSADPGYAQGVNNRNKLFRDVLFAGTSLDIQSPAWGDFVPAIGSTVFETDHGVQTFSLGVAPAAAAGLGIGGGAVGGADEEQSLAAVARANPAVALDAVFTELLEAHERNNSALTDAEVAAFAKAAAAIAADDAAAHAQTTTNHGAGALVGPANSDAELAFSLESNGGGAASYGLGGDLLGAITAVTDRVRNAASTIGFGMVRGTISPAVGLFLGDVFVYLRTSTIREKIQAEIRTALLKAQAARAPGEKLVVIGHSLGGVILVDMLSSPADSGLPADLTIDALLTVGSQPGLFQALHLFREPPQNARTPKPDWVGSWFNVFDPIDPLAFRADPIFDGVKDLQFDSITGLASAHTTYFKRPQFYARCRKRLHDIGVL